MKNTPIYLSAVFARRHELREVRETLRALGLDCLCSWIDFDGEETGSESREECGSWAALDLAEIRECGTFVAFAEPASGTAPGNRGGRHVEFGFALALGKRCILVGRAEHHFHCLPEVEVVADVEALVLALRSVGGGR